MVFPRKLRKLLTEARSLFGKDDASDKDLRSFIYREMFNFLAVSYAFAILSGQQSFQKSSISAEKVIVCFILSGLLSKVRAC